MADMTVATRYTLPLGPIKMEVANISAVSSTNTYTATMQNPEFAFFVGNKASDPMTAVPSFTISGRVLTITSADLSASTGVLVVFGW